MNISNRFFIFLFFVSFVSAYAQPGSLHLGMLIDTPSAKGQESGSLLTELRIYPEGGLLTTLLIGVSSHFSLGVSYGGENIIGAGKPNMNPQPCVDVRLLILEEQYLIPGLLIGFNSQGYGAYHGDRERYAVKSRGFYAVISKNTSFLGGIGLHGGVNWSLEDKDGDSDPNFFAGCHKRISDDLVLLSEYDTAINDNSDNAIGSGRGYLNLGVRWSLEQRFFVEFAWKNILENGEDAVGSSREVKLVYLAYF